MARLTLRVAEEPLPEHARVVVSMHGADRPVLSGGGRSTLLCGACGAVVARRVDPATVSALVLRCPACCRHNVLPG